MNISNLGVGRAIRHSGENDSCYTPPEIFEALAITFDLDVCAPKGGLPWIPAKKSYSKDEDGLTSPWFGRVWMNPPYSKPLPWVEKFIVHGNGIALLPTSQGKWMDMLWNDERTAWVIGHKIRYIKPNGERFKTYMPVRQYLVAIGAENIEAINRYGKSKK